MADEMLGPSDITVVSAAELNPEEVETFLDGVVGVENRAWPPELRAPRQKFESRLNVFPQGFFAFKVNGEFQAVTTSQIVNYDPNDTTHKTWDEITDNGMIEATHNPQGNALYVVSVGVARDSQGGGLGGKLVEQQKQLARKLGLKYLYLGARMPDYSDYLEENPDTTPEQFMKVRRKEDGQPEDKEIRFYERQGLTPTRVIRDFEPDDESAGNGVVMVWQVE